MRSEPPKIEDEEVLKEFLVESVELLDKLERDLVALEKGAPKEKLAAIFRGIHTIKGTCGFLGFAKLEALTHTAENLLGRLRDGKLAITPEIVTALLTTADAVRAMLTAIAATGREGEHEYQDLIARLGQLQTAVPAAATPAPPPVAAAAPVAAVADVAPPSIEDGAGVDVTAEPAACESAPASILPAADPDVEAAPVVVSAPAPVHTPASVVSSLPAVTLVAETLLAQATAPTVATAPAAASSARHAEPVAGASPPAPPPPSSADGEGGASGGGGGDAANIANGNVRVAVGLLERLMNLVGELVLARNQMLQFTALREDPGFLAASQRLNLITTELQEGVMKARMQPIDNVWNRFPRVVRDLANACGKHVRIEMEGRDTELDRTIIEAIKDPLTHLIRNAVDHGIELPGKRAAAGKPAEGRLLLRAFHEGGQVNIEISDDGAGIDLERVKKKALERSLVSAEALVRMKEREITHLVFLPGFSTAEKVTNVSGRGVGMDVVRTNVEKIGGTVDMQSAFGQGTTVKIKIPLTLAIIPALIVSTGGDRYAIPQVSLLELVRLEGESAARAIERIHGAPVYRLRGNLLPLVYLDRELGQPMKSRNDEIQIVVLQAGDRAFGLVVDEVNDTEEIVVKPLGKQLKGIPAFAGATIMGDGRVALILDVLGLAQRANVVAHVRGRSAIEGDAEKIVGKQAQKQALLLIRGPDEGRMAIPLSLVSRLEEFPRNAIEQTGGSSVVQYRGEILPLRDVSSLLYGLPGAIGGGGGDDTSAVQVVVYRSGSRPVGLVVERILDIVEAEIVIKRAATRSGVLGSMVLQGRVTEVLDLEGIAAQDAQESGVGPMGGYESEMVLQ